MIKDAIVSLKERTGSSQYAIAKFIEEKHKQLPSNFKKLLLQNLKKNVASGKLVKVKGSFKLSSKTKSSPVTTPSEAKKKPAAAKPKTKPTAVKAKPASKPKAKAVVKPKASSKAKTGAVKLKTTAAKSKVAVKPKAGVKAKPKEKSAKVARTSTRTSPGKKVATVKAAPKKVVAAKKAPVKSVKPKSVKSPAKNVSVKRGGRK
jgi:histone H1/5